MSRWYGPKNLTTSKAYEYNTAETQSEPQHLPGGQGAWGWGLSQGKLGVLMSWSNDAWQSSSHRIANCLRSRTNATARIRRKANSFSSQ